MADNLAGHAALTKQIERLQRLPELARRAAPAVATTLKAEVLAQVARQQGPDGRAWPKTQAGKPALQGLARSLSARAVGTVVLLRLVGIHARHHLGAVRGKVKRPVLPTNRIPDPAVRAIDTVVTKEFRQTMGVG